MSHLYITATPIGNLEDITLRALRILREVDYIVCEDTRHTGKLLAHYEIPAKGRLISYSPQATEKREEEIIEHLLNDKNIALVTDAGTPMISDPGERLLRRINHDEQCVDVVVSPIPGPSALTSALSIAGVSTSSFIFLGFPPQKKGRQTFFQKIPLYTSSIIMYESPHRLLKTLTQLNDVFIESGQENRIIVTMRELTKIHESRVAGTAHEVLTYFQEHTDEVRGECVIVIDAL